MSERIRLRSRFTVRERFKQFFTGARRLDAIVENGDSISYVGLTQNQGKIIELSCKEDECLFVREEYVLAHTNNVEIVINNKFSGAKYVSQAYFKVISRAQMPGLFDDFLNNETDTTVLPLPGTHNT